MLPLLRGLRDVSINIVGLVGKKQHRKSKKNKTKLKQQKK